MGVLTADAPQSGVIVGPDQFPLIDGSPLEPEHLLLSLLFEDVAGTRDFNEPDLKRYARGKKLISLGPVEASRAFLAAAERHVHTLLSPAPDYEQAALLHARYAADAMVKPLARLAIRFSRPEAFDFLLYVAACPLHQRESTEGVAARAIAFIEQEAASAPLTEGERYVLYLLRASFISGPPLGRAVAELAPLNRLIGDGAYFCLVPGEVWADAVNQDITQLDETGRSRWSALFAHMLTATTPRPSAKWLKTASKLVADIGGEQVRQSLKRWLPLVARGQSLRKLGSYMGDARGAADTMHDENASCLRGLLWITQVLPQADELAHTIAAVALSAYKKVPGVGPRAVKVGNAAVYALSQMSGADAVGQLAMLKVRVKFGTAQKEIEKAFTIAAEKIGLARDEIEELGVPSYGLDEGGKRRETIGEYEVEIAVDGSDARLQWFDARGKALKSVPAKAKKDHADDIKDLQQSLKDIQSMLPAQRDRIDAMCLLEKSRPNDVWRERYLDHPLVGTIARRLLWCVDGTSAVFVSGAPTNVQGQPIAHGKTAEITLWHPVGRGIEEITAWRRKLEELGITQPFKQAHREVYLLTEAERRTRTYSNRFAAHVIRQHQFNALCAARGWKNKLRLMVDDAYPPPTKHLPQFGLRAEFWVEPIGDDFGRDTNESGVYLRLATDQVRFYRTEAAVNFVHASGGGYAMNAGGPGQDNLNEPLPLEQIPPLVFSEIMRDVDLFVGVASVGNDPTWQDGGPGGRYRDYWQSFAFGDLSGTAATRKQVLERLIPRLKIAGQCSFSDRFLIVRGQKRTYKIHLGSGNILMEPNDQYLCIVPDSRTRGKEDSLFLPFEGDNTLSIIISKAFLLAADDKIQDPTINLQIDARTATAN
jgi:hypothetical protein